MPLSETGAPSAAAAGEWIGLLHLSARVTELVRGELAAVGTEGALTQAYLPALLQRLIGRGRVAIYDINGHRLDVDPAMDLAAARNFS